MGSFRDCAKAPEKQLYSQQNSPSGFCNDVALHFPRRVIYILKNNPDKFQDSEG